MNAREMAQRIAEVVNDIPRDMKAEDVTLRQIAELCWALGIKLKFSMEPLTEPDHTT